MIEPKKVVFQTNSDSKSIILITSDNVIYAKEGIYGGYLLYPKDFNMDVDEAVNAVRNSIAFYVEPEIEERIPKDAENIVSEYLKKLPEEVAEDFKENAHWEFITYNYIEVQPEIKKKNERYIVLEFNPKKGGKRLVGKAVRLYLYWQGSRKHPRGESSARLLKEWKLKYPENELIQNNMYAKTYLRGGRDSKLYFKIVIDAPEGLVPKPEAPVAEKPENIEDLGMDVEKVAEKVLKDVESVEVEMPTAVKPTVTTPTPTKPELVKIFLLKFKLPSRYLVQQARVQKKGSGFVEVRDFSDKERANVASALEGIRRKSYEKIGRLFVFVESYGMWIAVSEEAMEKAREVAKWLREELRPLLGWVDLKDYYIKAIPVYLEAGDARDLLYEAYQLLNTEVMKLQKKIREAEAQKKKKNLKRLEQQLAYKQKLLETLKKYLERLIL